MRLPNSPSSAQSTHSESSPSTSGSELRPDPRSTHPASSRGPGPQQRGTPVSRLGVAGFTLLGPALLLAVVFIGAGLVGVRKAIIKKTERQVTLDRITGEYALNLRASLLTLEASYKRLAIAQAAVAASCPATPACPAVTEAFLNDSKIEKLIHEAVKLYWNTQKTTWSLHFDLKSPYPNFDFQMARGNLLDLLTPWALPLNRLSSKKITLWRKNLLFGQQSESQVWRTKNEWNVAWTQ